MNRESTPAFRLDRILGLAKRAALGPSVRILTGYRNPTLAVERKSDDSPVTAFDREAEQHIREILKSDPDHIWPVLGEEFGGDTAGSPYRWVVDPIDGTMPYSRGLPYFGTLVAFEATGADAQTGARLGGATSATRALTGETSATRALVGAIQLPAFSELYTAARGMGAHCNGASISVAPRRDLADCIVSAPEIQKFRVAGLEEGYERLGSVVRHFRGNGDCWMHAMAARGAVDAVVEFSLNRWDIAATEVIVEEAGGRFYTRPSRTVQGKYDTVFGSATAAEEIVKLLDFRPV
jgi:histidinol-phosphatase